MKPLPRSMLAGIASGRAAGLLTLLALLALLAVRVGMMQASGAGLHVDEAQYWVWSQDLQWGYYSKPPLIAALIRLSTVWFGDGLLGIRLLCMACWLAASGVLVWLGAQMASLRAGVWAGALLLATPASGLLGLVATTDAPLLLGWTLCMAFTWQALRATDAAALNPARPPWRALAWWAGVGLALGLSLLAKYTALALLPSLAWVLLLTPQPRLLTPRQRVLRRGGPALAAWVAGLCLLPHLAWNASQHWPTLQHTLDITVRASTAPDAGGAGWLKSLGGYLAGQLLLTGPALWLVLLLAAWQWHRGNGRRMTALAPAPWRAPLWWALAFALPLQGLALLQALKGGAQLNWSAPSLAGLCLAGGLWLAARVPMQRRVLLALLVTLGLTACVALSRDLRWWHSGARDAAYRPLDFWHKTRYWDVVLQQLNAARLAHPGLVVATVERDVLVQAAYAWRQTPPALQSWRTGGPAKHHFELMQPLQADAHDAVLFLGSSAPPAALVAAFGTAEPLAQASSGRVALGVWLLRRTHTGAALP